MLSTPQYQIRKDKKSGLLVSPSKVTVVGPVDSSDEFAMPKDDAHAQVMAGSGPSPVPFAQQSTDFVSRQDFEVLNNQLEEKFERFEAPTYSPPLSYRSMLKTHRFLILLS